ncbi:MAG: queuosine precursor transporter [Spirochaetaceae bacterium]|nr:queuosine precursor transporter [Spirochaetaceae bacterium]
MKPSLQGKKPIRLLPVYSGLFTSILILSNILAAKIVQIGPFVFDGGTLLFPLSYIFGDVLTEVYGYRQSRKVIWTGFISLIIMVVAIWSVSILPAEGSWLLQRAFDSILLQMPRIALASIIGYFVGEYSNAVILSVLKKKTLGNHLLLRTMVSTLVGQLLDSGLFVIIAFWRIYSTETIITMLFSNYVFKCAIEFLFTPITYFVIKITKKFEGCEVFDYDEKYNPLP